MDLWEAVRDDDVIKVRSLLEQGANPNHQLYWRKDWWNMHILPPVHEACKKGNLEITKALVSGGADIKRGNELYCISLCCQEGNNYGACCVLGYISIGLRLS